MVGVFLITTDGEGAAPSMLAALNLQTSFVIWRTLSHSAEQISAQIICSAGARRGYGFVAALSDPLRAPEVWSWFVDEACAAESNIIVIASSTFINALLKYVAGGSTFDVPVVSLSHIDVGSEGQVHLKHVGITFSSPPDVPAPPDLGVSSKWVGVSFSSPLDVPDSSISGTTSDPSISGTVLNT